MFLQAVIEEQPDESGIKCGVQHCCKMYRPVVSERASCRALMAGFSEFSNWLDSVTSTADSDNLNVME